VASVFRGSSPHSRGAPNRHFWRAYVEGIIPAFAGSTRGRRHAATYYGDHPRIRGEHDGAPSLERQDPGSSPHSRGALLKMGALDSMSGIIPAFAGSTAACPAGRHQARDHPRIRGEHLSGGVKSCRQSGSSPHSRGAHGREPPGWASDGIIPAFAGSTDVVWMGRIA